MERSKSLRGEVDEASSVVEKCRCLPLPQIDGGEEVRPHRTIHHPPRRSLKALARVVASKRPRESPATSPPPTPAKMKGIVENTIQPISDRALQEEEEEEEELEEEEDAAVEDGDHDQEEEEEEDGDHDQEQEPPRAPAMSTGREITRRPSTHPDAANKECYTWWPSAKEWRMAEINATWKDEMDKRGVPYDTLHMSLHQLEQWREYFYSVGYDPDVGKFLASEFDDDERDDNKKSQ